MEAQITEIKGDLFKSPPNSYPKAFSVYRRWCRDTQPDQQLGNCILIEPNEEDTRKHWIACLLTSQYYGRKRDLKDEILQNTLRAMQQLTSRIEDLRSAGKEIGELFACKINSGKFGVPWVDTQEVLQQVRGLVLNVVEAETEDLKESRSGDDQQLAEKMKRS
ncbi:MAG: ADP-ribose 1''-phosphate phosphatase [Candelina submexicana]|nr:MAG: ADP-ribose 1''-phosphate phosphatase [Candelina submexicana]